MIEDQHSEDKLAISLNKTKIISTILVLIVCLFISVWVLLIIMSEQNLSVLIFTVIVGSFCIMRVVLLGNLILKNKPGLIFNQQGLIDNYSGTKVSWDKVSDFSISGSGSQSFLRVCLQQNKSILILGNVLDINFKKLILSFHSYWREYATQTRDFSQEEARFLETYGCPLGLLFEVGTKRSGI